MEFYFILSIEVNHKKIVCFKYLCSPCNILLHYFTIIFREQQITYSFFKVL